MRPFRYFKATSVEEATTILGDQGAGARPLAGGQSLLAMLNLGIVQLDALVDIGGIEELRGIGREDGALVLGALTRHRDLEEAEEIRRLVPVVAEAVRHVGSPRVRSRGTLGGSLAHSDPAAELPAAMLALEATYELSDGRSTRWVQAATFHRGIFQTELGEAELLTRVSFPVPGPDWGWGFSEVARRAGDFAIVVAVALARSTDGVIRGARVALAGAADRPVRCRTFEEAVVGVPVADVGRTVLAIDEDVSPLEDVLAGREYRRRVARVVALRALRDACRRAEEGR